MDSLNEYLTLSTSALRARLEAGAPVDPAALEGWLYRGISVGVPPWFRKLTWTTFGKTFYREPQSGDLMGWNVRMRQQGVNGPLEPMLDARGVPKTFGHYQVTSSEGFGVPEWCRQGLLIQYRFGGNAPWDPVNLARDPLVALDDGAGDLLLGWSYLQLGGVIATPSFFVLQRERAIDYVPEPPYPRSARRRALR